MTPVQTNDALFDKLAGKPPGAKRKRFQQGVEALSRQRFISLNAAGRGWANPGGCYTNLSASRQRLLARYAGPERSLCRRNSRQQSVALGDPTAKKVERFVV